jgi:hypothetical protein
VSTRKNYFKECSLATVYHEKYLPLDWRFICAVASAMLATPGAPTPQLHIRGRASLESRASKIGAIEVV